MGHGVTNRIVSSCIDNSRPDNSGSTQPSGPETFTTESHHREPLSSRFEQRMGDEANVNSIAHGSILSAER